MATKKIISIITCLIFSMANALAEEWNFDAIMKDKVIGKHTFSVNNEKIISKADFHIEFLFMDIYYQHKSEELWSGNCLNSISSQTNDDGDKFVVNGIRESNNFSIIANNVKTALPTCIMTFAYWNPKILEQDKLMNSQNGEYLDVKTTLLKQEKITIKGKNISTNCYEMTASKNGVEKLKIQLWYDLNMQWVALKSPTPIGDIFYKLL
tara:strand:- start:22834 stop:23460 length:627 start_codon:yes stop_codon:yes gene_type:complete